MLAISCDRLAIAIQQHLFKYVLMDWKQIETKHNNSNEVY